MSLSVPVIAFPYCQYPYTFGQKCYYYAARIYCTITKLMGIGIYSFYIRRTPLLTQNDVHSKTISELQANIKLANQSSMKNCIQFCSSAIIGVACQYGLGYFCCDLSSVAGYDLSYYNKFWKYLKYCFGGLFTFASVYNVLSNFYNLFVCDLQIRIIKHGKAITRAINSMKKDFAELDDSQNDEPSIGKNIYSQINESKSSWKLFRSENDRGELTYVVSNNYYEHLIFVFNVYNTAVEFMKKLSELSIYDVDFLAENREEARAMRNQFIKTKLCNSLIYDYYVFASNPERKFMSEHPRRNKSELESLLDDGSFDSKHSLVRKTAGYAGSFDSEHCPTSCSNSFED